MENDVEFQTPVPWELVDHVHRSKSGKTTMQISLSVELRARMAQAAIDLGCSKLALIRAALSKFLMAHEESRSSGQGRAYAATSEVLPPVSAPEPVSPMEPTVEEPELELKPESFQPELQPESEPEPESAVPEQTPKRAKKARAK